MNVSWDLFIKCLLPIYSVNWFAYIYFLLYLLSPFINDWIHTTSKNSLIKLLLVMAFIWCVIPAIFSQADMGISHLGWFIYLYCIGAFIRLYVHRKISLKTIIAFIITMMIFMYGLVIFVDALGIYIPRITMFIEKIENYTMHVFELNSIFIVCISIGVFLLFKNLKIRPNRYINDLAMTMFGVYLIHDNPIIRHMLWIEWFKNSSHVQSHYLWLWAGAEVALVFVVCILIDGLRIQVLEKPLFAKLNPKIDALEIKCKKHIDQFVEFINVVINK